MQKRVDVDEACYRQDITNNEAKVKLRDTIDNWKEYVKN